MPQGIPQTARSVDGIVEADLFLVFFSPSLLSSSQ
jgi:hypothetical protein